jgi:hypothetical protein
MKKDREHRAKLKLCRESIQLLESSGLNAARGASGGEDCSIGSGCITCRCTTTA